jgi:hypothetical protein
MSNNRLTRSFSFLLYGTSDGPRFIKGHAVSLAMVGTSAFIYLSFWAYFRYLNKRKLDGKDDHKVQGKTPEEIEEMGEHNPRFLYTY